MAEIYTGNLAFSSLLKTEEYTIDLDDLSAWKANWLKSDFGDKTWNFKQGNKRLDFDALFTNGESLIDPKYISLLNTIKKIIFLKRSSHLANISGNQTTRTETQYRLARRLITIAQYLVNQSIYKEGEGFSAINKNVLDDLITKFVEGGSDSVSGHFDIVEGVLLDATSRNTLENFLTDGAFSSRKFSEQTGIRTEVASRLSPLSKDKLKGLCLFPEHKADVYGNQTEYNNATPLRETQQRAVQDDEDAPPKFQKISDSNMSSMLAAVNELNHFYAPLRNAELSHYTPFKLDIKDYTNLYYSSRRTPNIPTNVATSYIDAAVEFVLKHGDNLVCTLRDSRNQITEEINRRKKPRKDHVMKSIRMPRNSTTEFYGVSRYNVLATGSTAREKRNTVSLEMLLEIFQSAVFILLITFACKRYRDVLTVKHAAHNVGYAGMDIIKFGLAKADPAEVLRTVGRPVPAIVADAFNNLKEINEIILDKASNQSCLLFQRSLSLNAKLQPPVDTVMSRDVLIRRLVQFADFVEIPTVTVCGIESRWYLNRIHMMRRFFACAYYCTFDKQHLPALTWLMGHANTEQTMHYVTQNLSNAEMSSSEAASVLASIIKDLDADSDVVTQLSEAFGEKDMSIIVARNERLLERRIDELFKQGYRIEKKVSGELVLLKSHNATEQQGEEPNA